MVSKQTDKIDFGKLEAEVYDAVDADAKYQRENDAKFRAVHQRVATYDEFRDIVLASHIKPLERNDMLDLKPFNQQWNQHATKGTDDSVKDNDVLSHTKSFDRVPKNGHEFTKEWRRRFKTPSEKYHAILSLGGPSLGQIFKAEVGFGLLGEFIEALHSEYEEKDASEILLVLKHLSETNRFQLSVDFLSSSEKQKCGKLFDRIGALCAVSSSESEEEHQCKIDPLLIRETRKNYGIPIEQSATS